MVFRTVDDAGAHRDQRVEMGGNRSPCGEITARRSEPRAPEPREQAAQVVVPAGVVGAVDDHPLVLGDRRLDLPLPFERDREAVAGLRVVRVDVERRTQVGDRFLDVAALEQ